MSKLPQITATKTLKKLQKAGLVIERTTGSHYILRSDDGLRHAVVPMHKGAIKKGTLSSILKGAKLSIEEFIEL